LSFIRVDDAGDPFDVNGDEDLHLGTVCKARATGTREREPADCRFSGGRASGRKPDAEDSACRAARPLGHEKVGDRQRGLLTRQRCGASLGSQERKYQRREE
jgi:hypothetical protein